MYITSPNTSSQAQLFSCQAGQEYSQAHRKSITLTQPLRKSITYMSRLLTPHHKPFPNRPGDPCQVFTQPSSSAPPTVRATEILTTYQWDEGSAPDTIRATQAVRVMAVPSLMDPGGGGGPAPQRAGPGRPGPGRSPPMPSFDLSAGEILQLGLGSLYGASALLVVLVKNYSVEFRRKPA